LRPNQSLEPEYARAYNNRGRAYADLQEYERATEDYDQVIELHPAYVTAYYNRGLAYKELGEKEKATGDFEKFLTLTDNPQWQERAKREIEALRQ